VNERDIAIQLARLERKIDRIKFPEVSSDLASPILSLPVLRCCWLSTVSGSGGWYDSSGRGIDLTYNGDPQFGQDGLVGYWDLDGTGDYFSHVDRAGLDITGTETYVTAASRGLTMGGWFYIDTSTSLGTLMSKFLGIGNQRSYALHQPFAVGANRIDGTISVDGAAVFTVVGDSISIGSWFFSCLRFLPSTELAVFVNADKNTVTAGVPASIFSGSADFVVGGRSGGTELIDGRAAYCFLCACAVSDAKISSIFEQMRPAFRV